MGICTGIRRLKAKKQTKTPTHNQLLFVSLLFCCCQNKRNESEACSALLLLWYYYERLQLHVCNPIEMQEGKKKKKKAVTLWATEAQVQYWGVWERVYYHRSQITQFQRSNFRALSDPDWVRVVSARVSVWHACACDQRQREKRKSYTLQVMRHKVTNWEVCKWAQNNSRPTGKQTECEQTNWE